VSGYIATPKNVGTCNWCYDTLPTQDGVLLPHGVLGQPQCEGSGQKPQHFCDNDDHDVVYVETDGPLGHGWECSKCDWWQVG
jgi:hypothetical protein